ncbi:cytochrome P450 phenylacetate 2-hydroxylase-like protein [Geopyxis carbonaria]|nr:cytochrome P450 phenylacetate 2-hydroxylase-like protein [Geopyxis carbonaria]
MSYPILLLAALPLLYSFYRYLYGTTQPYIKNLPEIPGLPLVGSLPLLGTSHARSAQSLARTHGPVFQARLGRQRVVFANTFASVKHFWITHSASLISRPTAYTFHSVVSDSSSFTIGTSPWDASCKARRRAAATALNRIAVQSYMPLLAHSSTVLVRTLLEAAINDGGEGVDPIAPLQRFALNTSLTLNYGVRLPAASLLLTSICETERTISDLRSTSHNWADYVPLLRLLPSATATAIEARNTRDKYMAALLRTLRKHLDAGTARPCITGNILQDPDSRGLTSSEIDSICLTMVSAGLDTVPGNLIMALGLLSVRPDLQTRLHDSLLAAYDGDAAAAWRGVAVEEKVPYVTAFVKETLRYWTVIPICLPRVSTAPIPYNNAIIPAGTTFLMNSYAADYDETHFIDAASFRVERWLEGAQDGTQHYAYGAGSRMCAGSHLANREMFLAISRLVLAFVLEERGEVEMDAIRCSRKESGLTTDPKAFKVGIRVRDRTRLEEWLVEEETAEEDDVVVV